MSSYREFVSEKVKPADDVIPTIDARKVDLLHAACGISGEGGEVLDLIKKHVFYDKPLDRDKLVEELGDIEFYMQLMRLTLSISREDVINNNVLKLSKRYKKTYTDAEAIARNDEGVA